MLLGAAFAWAWIPDLQNCRDDEGGFKLPSKTLEELGDGLVQARASGQQIGFRVKLGPLIRFRKRSRAPSVGS